MDEWRIRQQERDRQRQQEGQRLREQQNAEETGRLRTQFAEQRRRQEAERQRRAGEEEQKRIVEEQQRLENMRLVAESYRRIDDARNTQLAQAREKTQQQASRTQEACRSKDGRVFPSPLEAQFWDAWIAGGYEEMMPLMSQYRISKYCVDFADPSSQTAIEADGYGWHYGSRRRAHRHEVRDHLLKSQGWEVIHFTGRAIHLDASACAREVYQTISARVGKANS